MTISGALETLGPLITVVLACLLLTKELLICTGRSSRGLHWALNAFIIPLLVVFLLQVVIRIFTLQ